MSRDIPIIFSARMVRALLDGRKGMTRRLVTPRSCEFGSIPSGKLTKLYWEHAAWDAAWPDHGFPDQQGFCRSSYLHVPCHDADTNALSCAGCNERGWAGTVHRLYPRIQPGDRLWVRESFATPYKRTPTNPGCIYRADGPEFNSRAAAKHQWGAEERWTPSIHMPRWASRLTLDVEAVKIERLQEISHDDAVSEGASGDNGPGTMAGFIDIWKTLHGEASWQANPLVVAISFRPTSGHMGRD